MALLMERGQSSGPKKNFHLNIGQLFACREAAVLQTLLGSCVSACLYDPVAKVGGMNHILLPGKADMTTFNDNARYGVNAMELLINEMCKLGASRFRLLAKIFGGARVLPGLGVENSPGEKNIKFVIEYLQMEKIRLLGQDTGGFWTRIIQFHTDSFEVFVKKIQSSVAATLLAEEENYRKHLAEKAAKDSDVTLF